MNLSKGVFIIIFILECITEYNSAEDINANITEKDVLENSQRKMSEYINTIIEHYKQKDPIGIPDAPIPDPLPIPPLSHSFSVGRMDFKNVQLFGLSKFRIHHVKADLTAMKVEAALTIKTLNIVGNYTLSTWLSRTKGPFTVNLSDVYIEAIATLEVERNGQLEAQEMNMDITFKNIEMDFKGLGFFANMFQGVINSVGTFIFDSIKPFILSEVNTNLRNDVNKQVRKIPQKFPNSISPFDQLLAEIRRKIRNEKFDPYKVNDYNNSVGVFDIYMSHTWLTGLSSIHRVDSIQFEIRNNTVYALLEIGTQKLEGTSHWEVSLIAGMMSRAGTVSFSVNYFRVQIALNQTMDTRNSPMLEDIQLELGNIQVRFNGAGTIDYVIEFLINVIPNILRYQIMDALETPVKYRIQEVLNTVKVESMIKENVKKFDENPSSLQFLR